MNARMPSTSHDRRTALIDFVLTVAVVLASIPLASTLTPAFRRASGLGAALALAALQFTTEGLVPLLIMAARRERWSDYGFTRRNLGKSLVLGRFSQSPTICCCR